MYLFDDVINDGFLYTESGNREIKENLKKSNTRIS